MNKRYLRSQDKPWKKNEQGQRLCRWCQNPVPPPKRSWCSDLCVSEYKLRSDPEYAREQAFFRDKGVCADCGLDTLALKKAFVEALHEASGRYVTLVHPSIAVKQEEVIARLKALGFSEKRKTFWDLDHKVRVVDGGGACGMENLQTLCCKCHTRKSATENKKLRK